MGTQSKNETFKVKEPKWRKLFSRPQWIVSSFVKETKEYGLPVGASGLLWWMSIYLRQPRISAKALSMSTKYIDRYFLRHYGDILDKYSERKNSKTEEVAVEDYPIWCFWWQGEALMPEVVRHCYNGIKSNNSHVFLITKDNIEDYVKLPASIYEKVEAGKISFTHLSDILRLTLLAERGGMWIDVTCFNPYAIPDEAKRMPFCSPHDKVKQQSQGKVTYWCNRGGWRSWNLGTNQKNSLLFTFARDMIQAIAIRQNCMPSYFMVDCMLDYAYRHFPEVKSMIDHMPNVNTKCADLFLHYFNTNKVWDESEYQRLVENDWIFKLTYKTIWKEEVDGQPTFYGKLFNFR